MRFPYLLALSCACLPVLGFAQSAPCFYGGAGAVLVRNAPFESYANSQVGPAATLGLQLSSRWAVETGLQVTWRNSSFSYTSSTGAPVGYDTYTFGARSTGFLVPLLARYTFTAPASRLRVDALGGGSWLHSASRYTENYTVNGQFFDNDSRKAYDDFGLALGPQLRYAFGSHLEAKLNLPLNLLLNSSARFGDRLFLNPQLGVQYVLGW